MDYKMKKMVELENLKKKKISKRYLKVKEPNPYYQKNNLFIEADKNIYSNILQPFFKSIEQIQEEQVVKNINPKQNELLLNEALYSK